jgi:hypothetical protein
MIAAAKYSLGRSLCQGREPQNGAGSHGPGDPGGTRIRPFSVRALSVPGRLCTRHPNAGGSFRTRQKKMGAPEALPIHFPGGEEGWAGC